MIIARIVVVVVAPPVVIVVVVVVERMIGALAIAAILIIPVFVDTAVSIVHSAASSTAARYRNRNTKETKVAASHRHAQIAQTAQTISKFHCRCDTQ